MIELPSDIIYFRGVSSSEARKIKAGKKMLPSTDLIPFDNEVLELVYGGEYSETSQDDIDTWLKNLIPWYDGSIKSVKGGLNLTEDFENACGYGQFVVGVNTDQTEVSKLGEEYAFARSAAQCRPAFIFNTKTKKLLFV